MNLWLQRSASIQRTDLGKFRLPVHRCTGIPLQALPAPGYPTLRSGLQRFCDFLRLRGEPGQVSPAPIRKVLEEIVLLLTLRRLKGRKLLLAEHFLLAGAHARAARARRPPTRRAQGQRGRSREQKARQRAAEADTWLRPYSARRKKGLKERWINPRTHTSHLFRAARVIRCGTI